MKRGLAMLSLVILSLSGGCGIHRIAVNPGRNAGLRAATSEKRAREIMGKNYFGIEEAAKYFGVQPTSAERSALANIPFSRKTLESCRDTYILVAVFPLSVNDVHYKAPTVIFFDASSLWAADRFATYKGDGVSWQLIRKTPVPNSFGKTYQEQQALLSKNEEVPTARVLVYAIIGHYLATGERLFNRGFVRSSDVGLDGHWVYVGDFVAGGLHDHNDWDYNRYDYLGVSSARKSD